MGWNTIRLGVVWAGAQPTEGDALDADFLKRLHDILDLTDRTDIHVVLDNHGDMVGSAGCGNGVPMWFQQKVRRRDEALQILQALRMPRRQHCSLRISPPF